MSALPGGAHPARDGRGAQHAAVLRARHDHPRGGGDHGGRRPLLHPRPAREGLGIVTDVDMRDKVVMGDVPRDAPVTTIMCTPVHTIGSEILAPEASIAMMAAGVNHLPVLDPEGKVVGIVSASNLMSLEGRSPFALRRSHPVVGRRGRAGQGGRRHPQAVPRPARRTPRRSFAHAGAHGAGRLRHGAPARARHRPPRRAAGAVRLAQPSAAPHAASSPWPPTRTTGSPTPTPTTRPWTSTSAAWPKT